MSEPAEEEGSAARGSSMNKQEGEEALSKNTQSGNEYPEQRHAGKLEGFGPEYGAAHRVVSHSSKNSGSLN